MNDFKKVVGGILGHGFHSELVDDEQVGADEFAHHFFSGSAIESIGPYQLKAKTTITPSEKNLLFTVAQRNL
jgi:hypothetical protein